MATYRKVIRDNEALVFEKDKDSNVVKILMLHFAQMEAHKLYMSLDEEIPEDILNNFEKGMEEYLSGKPVQHIKGVETFFGRDFTVNEDVLIPRYETEELVENVLYALDEHFNDQDKIVLADVGTGSGAIAISLQCEEPKLEVYATDISDKALQVAKSNASRLQANVTFMQGDMLQPIIDAGIKLDVLVSNPPYIPISQEIENVVKDHEPHVALFGGDDGLFFYRKIFEKAMLVLKNRAIMAFEMGYDQRDIMIKEVDKHFKDYPYEIIQDMNGKDRMLFIYINTKDKQ